MLKVTLLDASGTVVEEFTVATPEALTRISEFVRLHGTDPDENGRAAQAGSVLFEPA